MLFARINNRRAAPDIPGSKRKARRERRALQMCGRLSDY